MNNVGDSFGVFGGKSASEVAAYIICAVFGGVGRFLRYVVRGKENHPHFWRDTFIYGFIAAPFGGFIGMYSADLGANIFISYIIATTVGTMANPIIDFIIDEGSADAVSFIKAIIKSKLGR